MSDNTQTTETQTAETATTEAQGTTTQTTETATAETSSAPTQTAATEPAATTTTPATATAEPAAEPTALDKLLKLREEFAKAHDATGEALAAVDRQINAEKTALFKAKQEEALKQLIPGDDKDVLKGHDIEFLINNTKEAGHGPDSLLGASVAAAHRVYSLVGTSGVKEVNVKSRFWGERTTTLMSLEGRFGKTGYNTTVTANAANLLPAAKEILAENTPGNTAANKSKHYVITGNGAVSGDVANAVAILEAAAKFNPNATFDFVVCNTAGTNVDALVQQWSANASGQKPNLVKVGKPEEISGAVLSALKARLAGEAAAQPAAKNEAAETVKATTTTTSAEQTAQPVSTAAAPAGETVSTPVQAQAPVSAVTGTGTKTGNAIAAYKAEQAAKAAGPKAEKKSAPAAEQTAQPASTTTDLLNNVKGATTPEKKPKKHWYSKRKSASLS